jgi:hypothetical protein
MAELAHHFWKKWLNYLSPNLTSSALLGVARITENLCDRMQALGTRSR